MPNPHNPKPNMSITEAQLMLQNTWHLFWAVMDWIKGMYNNNSYVILNAY